jgi:hypothetical protein
MANIKYRPAARTNVNFRSPYLSPEKSEDFYLGIQGGQISGGTFSKAHGPRVQTVKSLQVTGKTSFFQKVTDENN